MIKTHKELQKEWANPYVQWYAAGMPSFNVVNLAPYLQLTVNFETKQDRLDFDDQFQYNLTENTNVVWYPSKEQEKNILSRIVED